MSCTDKENLVNIDTESTEISVIYRDLERLNRSLGKMGLFHTQLMLEQVTADYERAIFRRICSENKNCRKTEKSTNRLIRK